MCHCCRREPPGVILGLRVEAFANRVDAQPFDDDTAHSVIVSVRGAGYAIAIDRELLLASA